MAKTYIYTCDRCKTEGENQSAFVTEVEIFFGGCGAARDNINSIDLCRKCYGELVSAIKLAAKPIPEEGGAHGEHTVLKTAPRQR